MYLGKCYKWSFCNSSCAVMLIQKGANVNKNVIEIPKKPEASAGEESNAKKWQLKSANTLPMKSTCEPVFKVS